MEPVKVKMVNHVQLVKVVEQCCVIRVRVMEL